VTTPWREDAAGRPLHHEVNFLYTTGRTVYHWHTRTKTGRAPQLNAAAPAMWVELSPSDAGRLGVADGDWVELRSRRGTLQARARVGGVREGVVFAPFHYGYWDQPTGGDPRAANELTVTDWDPVSKQPVYKACAVSVAKVAAPSGQPERVAGPAATEAIVASGAEEPR
jgi:anaerobic selenocysteine-containing dehydrogenase